MNEEILIRMGLDASSVKRGTMVMLDQQKKAAMDYVGFWKKAIDDKDRLEQQQFEKSRNRWRQELQDQRRASGARGGTSNARGVSVESLARSVGGRVTNAAAGHLGGVNSGAVSEVSVLARELAAGNMGGFARSLSVLASRMGWMAKAAGALINPITGVIAGLVGGVVAVNAVAGMARNLRRDATRNGFSVSGYQGAIYSAEVSQSGGGEAIKQGITTLNSSVMGLNRGDASAQGKFSRYGIETSKGGKSLSTEEIFTEIVKKYDETGNAAKRAAMAQDLLGDSYKDFIKILEEGSDEFEKRKKSAPTLSAGAVAQLENSDLLKWFRGYPKGTMAGAANAYANITSIFTGRGIINGTNKGVELDKRLDEYNASHPIKLSPRALASAESRIKSDNPELYTSYRGAKFSQEEAKSAIEDRGKSDLSTMADAARRFTGTIRPRLYTVTTRQKIAMGIDNKDAEASNAFLQGDDAKFKKLRGEADAMRAANPWLKLSDRSPTAKMEVQLEAANRHLNDIQKLWERAINAK